MRVALVLKLLCYVKAIEKLLHGPGIDDAILVENKNFIKFFSDFETLNAIFSKLNF